jgi:hypothetical protein
MNMRLLGARTIKDLVPEMVDTSNIHAHIAAVPSDRLYDDNCVSFLLVAKISVLHLTFVSQMRVCVVLS